MKWKTLTVKNALLIVSIVSVFLAAVPVVAVSADQPNAKKLASIESVAPIGEGSTSELIIKLSAPATFTSYKTTSPLRLVVDLSQVTEGNVVAPVVVNQGNFKTVSAKRFDTEAGVLTRVEIELESDSEALINSSPANPGELRISFPDLAASAVSTVKNDPPVNPAVPAELPNTVPAPVSEPVPVPAPAPAPVPVPVPAPVVGNEAPTRTLTAVLVSNNTITLALDGEITEFKAFRLNKPERYVVDLMGVKSGLPSRLLPLNASGVASARIGLYPDKVRVVLDAVNGTFPEATSAKTDTGVVITLDVKAAEVQAEKPAEVKTEISAKTDAPAELHVDKNTNKPMPPPGTSVVEMIDFQVVNGISRVSVKLKGDINAEQPVKIPGYVTLTIKNSVLPKNLQRSLETRAFVTPVLRVTPLSVKTKKSVDTKIRIALRIDASFDYRREGDMLNIDFIHPEGLAGDKLIIEAIDQKNRPVRQKTATASDDDMSADLSPVAEPVSQQSGTSRNYKGRKVTLEFADAEVRKIFQLLSEVSNKNFVLGDDVTGAISLKLVNVPWDQALDIILDTKGLDKREDGNIILIKGKGKFRSQAEEELEIRRTAAKSIELKTETFSVNYADLTAITSQFEKLKTPERGSIASDVRTSKVIVKDTPQALNDMRDLLYQLDLPEKQVMIEARIVEATSTFSRSLGVNWGVHSRDGSASFLGINALDSVFGGIASSPPTTGTGSAAGGSMGISFGTLASTVKLDMRLSAAASAGMVKIISSPKVATLNHKAAKISQGQQIPYQNTTATTGAVTAFVAATLSLEVTPHINANGTIVMKIDAKNDAPGTGSPPPINTKQATTELLLKDGETTVIGGIFVDSDQEGDDGVPFLMDIPFLGNLFKSNTKSKTKTELLIFITPRILGSV